MKGPLTELLPPLRRLPWEGKWYGVSRDQAFQLFIVLNELLLGLETTLAHVSNGTVKPFEWTPILFGPIAGIVLIAAYVAGLREKRWSRPVWIIVSVASTLVGVVGTYLHVVRTIRPFAPVGLRITLDAVVWGLPLLAPPAFALVGVLGLVTLSKQSAARKTQPYLLLSCIGMLIAATSSVIDHLRGGFTNPWLWVPTAISVFATVVTLVLAMLRSPSKGEIATYAVAMLLMMAAGPLGTLLHILFDLGPGGTIVVERLLRQAPVLAPMVFANYGLMGMLALLDGEA